MSLNVKFLVICVIFNFISTIKLHSQSIKVSTFGFQDPTTALHRALLSKKDTIIIDYQTKPWLIGPMIFKNIKNKVIILEKGVELKAKNGAFKNSNDALLMFLYCQNIKILGNGGQISMNKEEYREGEWRHGISLRASENIVVKDLTVRDTGGDGIYIAGAKDKLYSENIIINNIKSLNNKRQGITIISAKGVLIENSLFAETKGIQPAAGIDIEPNNKHNIVSDIRIINCVIRDNFGPGIVIGLRKLEKESAKISILVENCIISSNHSLDNPKAGAEIIFGANKESPVTGIVIFRECLIKNSNWGVVYSRKRSDAYTVLFDNCMVRSLSANGKSPAIYLEVPDYYKEFGALGGYHFNNFYIENMQSVPFVIIRGSKLGTLKKIENITGNVTILGIQNNLFEYINYNSAANVNINLNAIYKVDL
ncbi:hypothetical protein LCGC14_1540660, partial [marine sediment metagenome]